jgi:hypothetical protein
MNAFDRKGLLAGVQEALTKVTFSQRRWLGRSCL